MFLVDHVMTKWLESKRLKVQPQRCVRTRNRFSTCMSCSEACPVSAISLSEGLSVKEELCTECMKCTINCPSEALYDKKYPSYFKEMPNREMISFSCENDHGSGSHIQLSCLSQLDHALLLHSLNISKQVTIQFQEEKCLRCRKYDKELRNTLNHIIDSLNGMLKEPVEIMFNQTATEKMEPSYTRRDLITFFSKKVTNQVVGPLLPEEEKLENLRVTVEKGTMSAMYQHVLKKNQASLLEVQAPENLKSLQLAFTDFCNGCSACSRVCATGALKFIVNEENTEAIFTQRLCYGCESCIDICRRNGLIKLTNQISLTSFLEQKEQTLIYKEYKRCEKCGNNHIGPSSFCEGCQEY